MERQSLNQLIRLSNDEKKRMMEEIKAFYLDERDEEIGIIEQQQILELFLEYLAPAVYNKGLDDAMSWYKKQQENLESDFYMLYKEQRGFR